MAMRRRAPAGRPPFSIRQSVQRQSEHVLETGRRFTRFDQLRQRHFWSCHMFIPDANGYVASGNFPVFVTPVGQNGQGFPSGVSLTERETNWKSQNRVPDNQNFEITEIGVSLDMVTNTSAGSPPAQGEPEDAMVIPALFNQVINNCVVFITYLTNSVPLGLVADFAQPAGVQQGSTVINPTVVSGGEYFRSNGFSAPALRRRFKIPILLQHGETFSFAFNYPRAFWAGPFNTIQTSAFILRFDFWATESFVEKS